MATKLVEDSKPDPKTTEFEVQKARFEAAVAKTKADGDTPPEVEIPATDPAKPAAAKPTKKPKKAKPAPSALESQVAEIQGKLAELGKPKTAEPEADDKAELVRARLSDRFGEEEADALLESFDMLREDDRRQIAKLSQVIEEATKAGRANLSKTNKRRLTGEYAQLKNEGAWGIVHREALAAYERDPKRFESIEDAYDEVAAALYGEPEEDDEEGDGEAPEEIEEAASRIAASQMTAPTKAPRRESRSKEERAKEHFEFLKKHPEDLAGAKRLAKELGLR